jgi:hypothetical protein
LKRSRISKNKCLQKKRSQKMLKKKTDAEAKAWIKQRYSSSSIRVNILLYACICSSNSKQKEKLK